VHRAGLRRRRDRRWSALLRDGVREGEPITQLCHRARLRVPERIALIVSVCQAIQHAHQIRVIHRDLKSSNVLVTLQDGTPVPKVIDFGMAKAVHTPLTDSASATQAGQWVVTPAYMSPEQLGLTGQDIDTRTDMYSLGVLLHELLVGARPYDEQKAGDRSRPPRSVEGRGDDSAGNEVEGGSPLSGSVQSLTRARRTSRRCTARSRAISAG
jgi:serine/threonine protein kinase